VVFAAAAVGGTYAADPSGPPADLLPDSLALIRQGHHEDARKLLEPAVAEHPDWAKAHVFLALTYVEDKRWETARALFEKALSLQPKLDAARVPYGWCLYYLGELDDARTQFQAYLKLRPDYIDAVFALGLISFDRDELDAAIHSFRQVSVLAEERGDATRGSLAHMRLADVYLRRDNLSRAKLELRQAIRFNPEATKAHFKMAHVLRLMGDDEGADAARRKYDELKARAAEVDPRIDPRGMQ
jgi:Tfp pilus assembly protein PilF